MKNIFLILIFWFPILLNAQKDGVKGKVIDKPTRESMDSVKVTMSFHTLTDSATFFAITDSAGEFQIENIPPGVYVMTMEKSGYAPTVYRGVIVSELKTTYFDNPPIEMIPIGYKEPKQKKVSKQKESKKKSSHKKKNYWEA